MVVIKKASEYDSPFFVCKNNKILNEGVYL